MVSVDTIVALSSANGVSARMMLRLSGPRSHTIARRLCPSCALQYNQAATVQLQLRRIKLRIILYTFPQGQSFTGEDTIEFHVPGNPLLARLLLSECLRLGARSAEPGEFTSRAYFNGRIDLTEAEGIAASIASHNAQQLRAARQLLAGELAKRLQPIMDSLANTLALVEAGIDFSSEEISFLPAKELVNRISHIASLLDNLLAESGRVEPRWHQRRAVLVGRPNAGKSTLLNALAQAHRAVVSPKAGTTRDAVSADVALRRGIIQIVDIAGLESIETTHSDARGQIATQMQWTAHQAIQTGDWILLIHDTTSPEPPLDLPRCPDLIIHTKHDLTVAADDPAILRVSAHTGHGLTELRDRLDQIAFGSDSGGAVLSLNTRHVQAILDAQHAMARAVRSTDAAELLAADLREALDHLGSILGQVTPDDVLGRIFSSFCIGK